MVFVVYPNDMAGCEVDTFEKKDGFIRTELLPWLDIPIDYRAIFDGTNIYLERDGAVTFIGAPFSKSEMWFTFITLCQKSTIK